MTSYFKDKEKRRGLIGTLVFHAALLLVFIFFGLTSVFPPEEMGVMVDFGNSEVGMGDVESELDPTEQEQTPQQQTPTEVVEAREEVATQEIEESITIPEKKEAPKEQPKEVVPEKKPSPSDELMKAFEKSSSTKPGNPGGEGNKPGVGNMGQPTGDPDGARNGGNGDGGISYSLSGRRMTKKPVINDNSQETGIVVVQIIVDKNGKVTKATSGAKGSTTTSAKLTRLAEESAMQTQFNANPDAAEEQVGTITFTFILK